MPKLTRKRSFSPVSFSIDEGPNGSNFFMRVIELTSQVSRCPLVELSFVAMGAIPSPKTTCLGLNLFKSYRRWTTYSNLSDTTPSPPKFNVNLGLGGLD